jgi:hypothetical protein
MTIAAGLLVAQIASAQTTPPAGSNGLCKDGTYSTAASKQGACRGHQGVKQWFAAPTGPAAPSTATSPTPSAPAPTAAPKPVASAPAYAPAATKASPSAKAAAMPQVAGGGPGLVWVNSSSNVYHCYGSNFYGKTKAGSYMSETDAKAKGAHADHGKPCSK